MSEFVRSSVSRNALALQFVADNRGLELPLSVAGLIDLFAEADIVLEATLLEPLRRRVRIATIARPSTKGSWLGQGRPTVSGKASAAEQLARAQRNFVNRDGNRQLSSRLER